MVVGTVGGCTRRVRRSGKWGPSRLAGRDALEGKGPPRRRQKWLGGRLEEVAKTVGSGYCRLQMPLKLALAVRGTVAGRRLGAPEGGETSPPTNTSLLAGVQCHVFYVLLSVKVVGVTREWSAVQRPCLCGIRPPCQHPCHVVPGRVALVGRGRGRAPVTRRRPPPQRDTHHPRPPRP